VPMLATVVPDKVHVTWRVRLRVPPSLNVPVAVNCRDVSCAIVGFAGVRVKDARFAAFTVRGAFPVTP
jgi:hypothetical protein